MTYSTMAMAAPCRDQGAASFTGTIQDHPCPMQRPEAVATSVMLTCRAKPSRCVVRAGW